MNAPEGRFGSTADFKPVIKPCQLTPQSRHREFAVATCSWRTLPFARRVSTKLIASP